MVFPGPIARCPNAVPVQNACMPPTWVILMRQKAYYSICFFQGAEPISTSVIAQRLRQTLPYWQRPQHCPAHLCQSVDIILQPDAPQVAKLFAQGRLFLGHDGGRYGPLRAVDCGLCNTFRVCTRIVCQPAAILPPPKAIPMVYFTPSPLPCLQWHARAVQALAATAFSSY